VRRGAASCRAVLGSCPVTAAVRAAARVPSPRSRRGWPSAPRRRDLGRGRAAQRVSPVARCPDAGQAGRCPVRIPGPVVGTSVQPVERTSSVHASGVQCHPGVRTDTLRCPRRCRRAVRAALDPGVARCGGPPPVGRSGSTCRRGPRAAWSPACIEPDGKGWWGVGRAWLARGLTLARAAAWSASRLRRRRADTGAGPEWRLGGGEHGTKQVLTGPPQVSWAVGGMVPTMGLD
jgi:hypothetical protein